MRGFILSVLYLGIRSVCSDLLYLFIFESQQESSAKKQATKTGNSEDKDHPTKTRKPLRPTSTQRHPDLRISPRRFCLHDARKNNKKDC